MSDKPLFIPLKSEFYNAFIHGVKTTEYRRHGPGWNAKTCPVGRRVVLSKGYGKANRVTGVIVGFTVSRAPTTTWAWQACYGLRSGEAACIEIKIDQHCLPNVEGSPGGEAAPVRPVVGQTLPEQESK
jgi:hypothetical protein